MICAGPSLDLIAAYMRDPMIVWYSVALSISVPSSHRKGGEYIWNGTTYPNLSFNLLSSALPRIVLRFEVISWRLLTTQTASPKAQSTGLSTFLHAESGLLNYLAHH